MRLFFLLPLLLAGCDYQTMGAVAMLTGAAVASPVMLVVDEEGNQRCNEIEKSISTTGVYPAEQCIKPLVENDFSPAEDAGTFVTKCHDEEHLRFEMKWHATLRPRMLDCWKTCPADLGEAGIYRVIAEHKAGYDEEISRHYLGKVKLNRSDSSLSITDIVKFVEENKTINYVLKLPEVLGGEEMQIAFADTSYHFMQSCKQ